MFLIAFDQTHPRFTVIDYLVGYLPCVFPSPCGLHGCCLGDFEGPAGKSISLQYQSITLLSSSHNRQRLISML